MISNLEIDELVFQLNSRFWNHLFPRNNQVAKPANEIKSIRP